MTTDMRIPGPRKPKRHGIPLPPSIPGRFFVIEYNRDTKKFKLVVDDEEHSSYDLGADIQVIMQQFRLWKLAAIGDRTVDTAKEFGMAQAILADGRIIPLYEQPKRKTVPECLREIEEDKDNGRQQYIHL